MELINTSQEIYEQAISGHPPYAVLVALSGGNDSLAAYYASKAMNLKVDGIIHVRTRTGIFETTQFVRDFAHKEGINYLEADAGDVYENRVLSKGFFGIGVQAHSFAYHLLKKAPLEKTISHNIRQRKRNRNVLILNGVRLSESDNRAKNYANSAVRASGSNIWVNILQHWSKEDCQSILSENKAPCNPVSKELCRSGECMCGTMQSHQQRLETASLYPEWGKWLDNLESRVNSKFPWGWGDCVPKTWINEKKGQLRLFPYQEDSLQMCSDCIGKGKM